MRWLYLIALAAIVVSLFLFINSERAPAQCPLKPEPYCEGSRLVSPVSCVDGEWSFDSALCAEKCSAGKCVELKCAAPCNDGNACTADKCIFGSCTNTALPDNTSCADGKACLGGECLLSPRDECTYVRELENASAEGKNILLASCYSGRYEERPQGLGESSLCTGITSPYYLSRCFGYAAAGAENDDLCQGAQGSYFSSAYAANISASDNCLLTFARLSAEGAEGDAVAAACALIGNENLRGACEALLGRAPVDEAPVQKGIGLEEFRRLSFCEAGEQGVYGYATHDANGTLKRSYDVSYSVAALPGTSNAVLARETVANGYFSKKGSGLDERLVRIVVHDRINASTCACISRSFGLYNVLLPSLEQTYGAACGEKPDLLASHVLYFDSMNASRIYGEGAGKWTENVSATRMREYSLQSSGPLEVKLFWNNATYSLLRK
ncbi:MAG: hypothetical protein WC759_01625 [Candidatus Micrarchaeia archaeon]|jgi:hypothetical protein